MKKYLLAIAICLSILYATTANAEQVLDIQKFTSEKGIEIWLAENHTIPLIAMDFSFDGGLDHDPDDKPGVGKMVSILLDEGSGELSSAQFQQELNDKSISMSFAAERDAFTGSVKTLTKNSELAFALLKSALTAPHFDKDAIERMKNANIASIKSNMGDPAWLAARTFNGMLFEGHRYSNPGEGTLQSIAKIRRKDLQDFAQSQFARSILKVSIAGDITKKKAIEIVDATFGDLPETTTSPEVPDVELQYLGQIVLLSLDTPQSYIFIGQKGIAINDPSWYAATIMNYILGGDSFDSHLMRELREKRGLTYGVYSSLTPMKHTNLIRASLSTSNEKVPEAMQVLYREWQKMARDGITEAELQSAKAYITGSLLLGLASNSGISASLNEMQSQGLDYDYINNYRDKINAVTVDDVKNVAKNMLDKNNLITIIVGKPEGISPDIILQQAPKMGDDDNEQINK